jgi:putative ABC transport system permease protein
VARAIVGAATGLVLLLLRAAAVLFTPLPLGRLLRTISIPRMEEHRVRTALTVFGVALGVAVLASVSIVNRNVLGGVARTVDDIAGKADLQVGSGSSGFSESLLDVVSAVPGVAAISPALQQIATIHDKRAQGERVLVVGVDMLGADDAYFRSYGSRDLDAIRKDPLPFLNSSTNILIGRELAQRCGYKLHDHIALATGTGIQQFEIWGLLDASGVGRAFGGAVAVMYYPAMQVAFGRGHNIDRIDIALEPGAQVDAVRARLSATLGSAFTIEHPARRSDRVAKMLQAVHDALLLASLIALTVGAFLIYNTIAISVVQRKREIGVLRAVGALRSSVLRLITLEGALLGTVGSLLGVGLGVLLSRGMLIATSRALSEAYLQLTVSDVRVDADVLLASFVMGVLATTLAAALPARRAGLVSPAETLRTSGMTSVQAPPQRLAHKDRAALVSLVLAGALLFMPPIGQVPLGGFLASGMLLQAGVLLLPRFIQALERALDTRFGSLFGLEFRLAQQNLPRDIGRTAGMVGALMVSVAMATSFATFVSSFSATLDDWIEQSLPGALFITNGASISGAAAKNVPMADDLYGPLVAMPEVKAVRRLRIVEFPYRGFPIKVVSTDTDVYARFAHFTMLQGTREDAIAGWRRGAVTVSENFARRFGVHPGDHIALSVKDGTRQFEVAAVGLDYASDIGTVFMDRAVYRAGWDDSRVDTYELHLRPGIDPERVRRTINERYADKLDLFVLTNQEFRAEVHNTAAQVFSLLRALELVALIVAVLGVVNAQLANVLDRVREIGVLRAVGMLRWQVRRMIVIEAALIGVLGASTGLVLGLALGYVLLNHINIVQTGWYFPYRLSARSVVELVLCTVPASALAGFYPARAAAGMRVTDALGYE